MYILLIIFFLVLILILYINQKNEHFDDKNIYSEKNVFVNNKQTLDIDNINVNRLCIKDNKGVECISKSELFNALELPIFRKHSYCIDDACMTKNNFKKIKGDIAINLKSVEDESKCVGFSNIPASLSLRTQKKWETDKFGLKIGDKKKKLTAGGIAIAIGSTLTGGLLGAALAGAGALNEGKTGDIFFKDGDEIDINDPKISYHSLYEPKGGWVRKPKDFCNKKHRYPLSNWKCDHTNFPNKGYCKKNYGKYDYDSINKYGCNTRHRSSPGVCWQSAGRRCHSLRQIRKNSINRFYRPKDRTQVDSEMKHIPTLELPSMKDIDCDNESDNSMNFQIDKGKLKSDITGLIGSEISTKEYRNISQHENHNWGKYK
tara:strand:- start:70 stop:1191 length:1122 start_codon:yes stop_codon:yes gene_type:complete